MSASLVAVAFRQEGLSAFQKLLLVACADEAPASTGELPSREALEEKLNETPRRVGRALAELRKRGLIEERTLPDGRNVETLTLRVFPSEGGETIEGGFSTASSNTTSSSNAPVTLDNEVKEGGSGGKPEPEADPEFEDWLVHHEETTGHKPPKPGTKAREALRRSYRQIRKEGWSAEEVKLATIGAHGDDFRREHGYDVAESILRPTKFAKLVNWGRIRTRGQGVSVPSARPDVIQDKKRLVQRGHSFSHDPDAVKKAKEAEAWLKEHGIEVVRMPDGYPTFRRSES